MQASVDSTILKPSLKTVFTKSIYFYSLYSKNRANYLHLNVIKMQRPTLL